MARETRITTQTVQAFETVTRCDNCGKEATREDQYRGMLPGGWYSVRRIGSPASFTDPDDRDFCSHDCLGAYYWKAGN